MRTDLTVAPTSDILKHFSKQHIEERDGKKYVITDQCWRTPENYKRTKDHEAQHVEDYKIIAGLVNAAAAGPKFDSKEACDDAVKKMIADWEDRAAKESGHDQSATPKPPPEGNTSIDEEWAASEKAGLCTTNGNSPKRPDYP